MAERAMDVMIVQAAGTVVRAGQYRRLRQGVVYRQGRAVRYRCANCNRLHDWDEKIWDERAQAYVGLDCAPTVPPPIAPAGESRERHNERQRLRWRGRGEAAQGAGSGR